MTVDPKGPLRMNNCSNHYGSKCSFSCAVGYRLNGSSTVTCNAPRERPPGAWDNPIPMCQGRASCNGGSRSSDKGRGGGVSSRPGDKGGGGGLGLKKKYGAPRAPLLDPPLGKLYFVGVVIYFIFVIVILMVFLSLT